MRCERKKSLCDAQIVTLVNENNTKNTTCESNYKQRGILLINVGFHVVHFQDGFFGEVSSCITQFSITVFNDSRNCIAMMLNIDRIFSAIMLKVLPNGVWNSSEILFSLLSNQILT
jgi:hypothetical protein